MARMTRIILFYVFIIVVCIFFIFHYLNPVQLEAGTYINPPQKITSFELTDHRGHPFTQTQLNEHWTLLFFGFSSCPMICPVMLDTLKQVEAQLPESKKVQVVFVSVDPAHDTVKRLNEYMRPFNQHFIALTGNMSAINALQKQLHMPVSKGPSSHGMEIILINPEGQIQAYFKFPMSSQALLEDVKKVIMR